MTEVAQIINNFQDLSLEPSEELMGIEEELEELDLEDLDDEEFSKEELEELLERIKKDGKEGQFSFESEDEEDSDDESNTSDELGEIDIGDVESEEELKDILESIAEGEVDEEVYDSLNITQEGAYALLEGLEDGSYAAEELVDEYGDDLAGAYEELTAETGVGTVDVFGGEGYDDLLEPGESGDMDVYDQSGMEESYAEHAEESGEVVSDTDTFGGELEPADDYMDEETVELRAPEIDGEGGYQDDMAGAGEPDTIVGDDGDVYAKCGGCGGYHEIDDNGEFGGGGGHELAADISLDSI